MDWKRALLFARMSEHAYRPEHHEGLPEGWTHVKSFRNERTGAQAFIAVGGHELVIAVKGTSDLKDALQDAKILLVQAVFGKKTVKVEKGFWEDYAALKERIAAELWVLLRNLKEPKVYVTGHSLGGAVASLLTLDLAVRGVKPVPYTFGSPMPGNAGFVRLFNKAVRGSWRVVHERDLVPGLPRRWWGFSHVGRLFHIDDEGRRVPAHRTFWKRLKQYLGILKADLDGEGVKDHFIKNYIECLEKGAASVH